MTMGTSGIGQVGRRRQGTGVPEADRREADGEGVAGGAESLGSPAWRPGSRALSSDNHRITSSLTPADVDRTPSRGETSGKSAVNRAV